MPAPTSPTRLQSLLSSLLLLALSALTLPITAGVVLYALLSKQRQEEHTLGKKDSFKAANGLANGQGLSARSRPTALINGARMQKSLFLARALSAQGFRVVLVEEAQWGFLSPGRFSACVDKFELVPSPAGGARLPSENGPSPRADPYIAALVALAHREEVDLFVPCSGAGTTLEDALAAEVMRAEMPKGFRAIIQGAELVSQLHEKDKFISLASSMSLDAPHSVLVHSPAELLSLLRQPKQPRRIIKCAAELDDVGRSDLTTYPLLRPGSHSEVDWERTEARIRGLRIPISRETPYIAQEFIGAEPATGGEGEGADVDAIASTTEWCTHATVLSGEVRAFVACPSNDMLMTYADASLHPVGRRALAWTRRFIAELIKRRSDGASAAEKYDDLDGHYSFDFIHQPLPGTRPTDGDTFWEEGRLVAIECNPRVHTAVGLLVRDNPAFGRVYAEALAEGAPESKAKAKAKSESGSKAAPLVLPQRGTESISWRAHDVPARLLPALLSALLPASVCARLGRAVHPLWLGEASSSSEGESKGKGESEGEGGRDDPTADIGAHDASWDAGDPLPALALAHLLWPYLLVRQVLVRRRAWSRVNVSTARIFEC